MSADVATLAFVAALIASLLVRGWLVTRQVRHVAGHRNTVPAAFAQQVTLEDHRKAADYTVARNRFGLIGLAVSTALLLGWTLLGGLDTLNTAVREAVQPRWGALAYQVALVVAVSVIAGLLDMPLDLWQTFRLEQRYGFNRTTWRTWLVDQLMGAGVMLVLGVPLVALLLWVMGSAGPWWWLYAFALVALYQLMMLVLVPSFIAPLFNKFKPLQDEALRLRVEALMQRCGFRAKGLYVMDGSRRSAHSNAYFTGFGSSKRVVFFDTLLASLSTDEIEAVLAHELGHFRLRHVPKHVGAMLAVLFGVFAALGWLVDQSGFYLGLGVTPNAAAPNHALALVLITLVGPLFLFFVTPLLAALSRRFEFQADAFACAQADHRHLAQALVKIHRENAATLTPDPLYVRFHYSHPPASERLAALQPRAQVAS